MNEGTLFVVGTPIGNLEDITLRALRILKEADVVLCEDTRVTKKLLAKYDITTSLKRLDANVEGEVAENITELFGEYKSIALVTDAGTPTLSDPGARFISSVRKAGYRVEVIPGPSAVVSALSISGLTADQFLFLGFLPHKKGRETLFKEIAENKRTTVFYESPHRVMKTLESLGKVLEENRTVVVAKELTKIFEEIISGNASAVKKYLEENPQKQKGEFVVLVSGC